MSAEENQVAAAQGGTPVVSLRNVGVCFRHRSGFMRVKRKWALEDVSFDVYHGETIGIIGPNGAGKSTVLRVIAGILQPDRGELIRREEYTASILGLQAGFLWYLSGRENIMLSGMLAGVPRRKLEERMDGMIEFCGLEKVIDDPLKTYSVGMRARLGFGLAWQADFDILLIDEVMGVGDAAFRKKSSEFMKETIRSKKTVVLVSHGMETIKDLCDRVVWMEKGEVVEIGPTAEVIERYETRAGTRRAKAARKQPAEAAAALPAAVASGKKAPARAAGEKPAARAPAAQSAAKAAAQSAAKAPAKQPPAQPAGEQPSAKTDAERSPSKPPAGQPAPKAPAAQPAPKAPAEQPAAAASVEPSPAKAGGQSAA